jgi:tannase/feruloyl esterase
VQSLRQVNPDIRKAFAPDDMKLVAARVVDKCDALDGAADGMVGDLRQCQKMFRAGDLKCAPGQNSSCLSAEQVTALERLFAGPKNSAGQQLYSDWPFDGGVGARNWRLWKLESTVAPWQNNPLIAIMGAGSLSYIFTTPPTKTEGTPPKLIDFLSAFDLDRDAPKIFATDGIFTESAMSFMTPPDVDDPKLAELKAKGHKLLVYHGQSDGVFSVNDTINWYEKLAANNGGDASAFARLFTVPGMNHCSMGPATDNFDSLGAMMDWVEKGKAPDRIIAKVNAGNAELPADWSKTRTRPLCPWPMIAKYKAGDKEQADSFACEAP